jgi:hypothetical protein
LPVVVVTLFVVLVSVVIPFLACRYLIVPLLSITLIVPLRACAAPLAEFWVTSPVVCCACTAPKAEKEILRLLKFVDTFS